MRITYDERKQIINQWNLLLKCLSLCGHLPLTDLFLTSSHSRPLPRSSVSDLQQSSICPWMMIKQYFKHICSSVMYSVSYSAVMCSSYVQRAIAVCLLVERGDSVDRFWSDPHLPSQFSHSASSSADPTATESCHQAQDRRIG